MELNKLLHLHLLQDFTEQILPLPSEVEDTIDDLSHTPDHDTEWAFNFEGWHEEPLRELLQLLPHSLLQITAAPLTDSSPEVVIHSVPLQFQPQC